MKIFQVDGCSMTPTIKDGQYVLVRKKRAYRYNDIIVFQYDQRYYIKRVQAVYKKGYFVLGDCFNSSVDSRTLGCIHPKNVIGCVFAII